MPEPPLHIKDLPGSRESIRVLRLAGPLTLANVFGFQSKVRADGSRALILDFTDVSLADSAGIGALVGAYVTRQKDGRSLGLVGVNQRIHQALEVTRWMGSFVSSERLLRRSRRREFHLAQEVAVTSGSGPSFSEFWWWLRRL
jgi:anti-sigma B factor antagonist